MERGVYVWHAICTARECATPQLLNLPLLGIVDQAFLKVIKDVSDLDKNIVGWLTLIEQKVVAATDDANARMSTLRELNKNCKEMIRTQDKLLLALNDKVFELNEDIRRIEFPELKPIDHTITDLRD